MSEPQEGRSIILSLRATFFTGIVLVVPLAITYWVLGFLFRTTSRMASPYVLTVFHQFSDQPAPRLLVDFCSLMLVIGFILLFGWLTSFYLGKKLLALIDLAMLRLPVVRSIYGGTKQIIEAFSLQKQGAFKRVVMVEYPRKGAWAFAFVTNEDLVSANGLFGKSLVGVFIPSIPNPTTGFLVYYDPFEILLLDLDTEEGVKLIVSAGMVTPINRKPAVWLGDHLGLNRPTSEAAEH